MSQKGIKNTEEKGTLEQETGKIVSKATAIAMFLLLVIFPVFITSQHYMNILRMKYKFFWVMVVVLAAVSVFVGAVFLFIDMNENKGKKTKEWLARFKPSCWKETFSLADGGVLIFIVIALISTLTSEYLYEAFWGNEGRYSGFFLLALYTVFYFLVSRFFCFKRWYLDGFLISSMAACIFGITDYFRMDIMGFKEGIVPEMADIFTSTFGNINTFTAFVGMVLAVSAALFALERDKKRTVWYYFCTAVSSVALITSQSDNGYLSVAAIFIALPFFLFGTRTGIRRYLIIVATFITAAAWVGYINVAMADTVIGLAGIGGVVTTLPGLGILAAVLWLAVIIWVWTDRKKKAGDQLGKAPRRIWKWLMVAVLAVVVICFVDANFWGHGERYGAMQDFLVFRDSWGTNRGFVWRIAMEDYLHVFTPLQKLFGYGPDTFGIITTSFNSQEMHEVAGQIFDSAHNAYIHYFATIGPIGLAGYLVFLLSSLRAMAKNWKKDSCLFALFLAVLGYSAQALVNIDLPIVTPFLWAFLGMGAAIIRRN